MPSSSDPTPKIGNPVTTRFISIHRHHCDFSCHHHPQGLYSAREPALPSLAPVGTDWRKSFAFFWRDKPDETQRANSAKNGTGSSKLKVADVILPLLSAFNNVFSSAMRLRDLAIATMSVISLIHAA